MGISYFGPYKKWVDITRTEQLFCSYLYHTVKGNENNFIKLLNNSIPIRGKKISFTESELECEWEIGYEVCFYRDYLYKIKQQSVRNSEFSPKRTFDLCLFSENKIIVIEAKVFERFLSKDTKNYKKDKNSIRKLLNQPNLQVHLVALTSSKYLENQEQSGDSQLLSCFDGYITWQGLYNYYQNEMFFEAEKRYK